MKVERIIPRKLDEKLLETYKKSNEFYIDSVLHKLNNLLVISVDDDRISPKYKIIDIDTGTVLRDCERNENIRLAPDEYCWRVFSYHASELSTKLFPIGEGLYFDEAGKTIYYKELNKESNKEESYKEREYYKSSPLITTKNWDAMSEYKFGLSVIYKDGKYGVINDKYDIVFPYHEEIVFIKIISETSLFLKDVNGVCAIYDVSKKEYEMDFKEGVIAENIKEIRPSIFKIITKEGNYARINKKNITDSMVKYVIFDRRDNTVILESESKVGIYTKEAEKIMEVETSKYDKIKDYLFYHKNNNQYMCDLKNKSIKKLNTLYAKNQDGEVVDIDDVLKKYSYYYIDDDTNKMTVFEDKVYGILIEINRGTKIIRWVDSLDKMFKLEEEIMYNILPKETNVLTKKRTVGS